MPRLPRVHIKGVLYYVTCRSEHQELIFKDKGDYQMFLGLVRKYKDQYGFKLFAYALLPNHMHLLMELPESGVSEIMHDLNSSYTKYFNAKYVRKGHLFRERFKAALIEKEPYLPKLTAYIHQNPKKLNLISDAKDYPYSSCGFYMNNGEQTGAMNLSDEVSEVLGYLKDKKYFEVLNNLSQEEALNLHKNLHRGGIIGSEEFIKKVKQEITQNKKDQEVEAAPNPKASSFGLKAGLLAFGVILAGAGVLYFLRISGKEVAPVVKVKEFGIASIEDLNFTEWELQLTPIATGTQISDTVRFSDGKFISAKMSYSAYPATNYSVNLENGAKIVWETMQTGPGGTASWRGEIEKDKMRGMLSLREEGKPPQDFSFISVGYRKGK